MNFNRFTDALGSAENRFISNLLYSSMLWESIKTDITVDYVGGSFETII
jgi:hypothetical protein